MEVTSWNLHHESYLVQLTPWKLPYGNYTMEVSVWNLHNRCYLMDNTPWKLAH